MWLYPWGRDRKEWFQGFERNPTLTRSDMCKPRILDIWSVFKNQKRKISKILRNMFLEKRPYFLRHIRVFQIIWMYIMCILSKLFKVLSHPALPVKSHKWPFLYTKVNPYAGGGQFQYKRMQKTWKMTGTLAFGYSSESTRWELSNEYQHDRV